MKDEQGGTGGTRAKDLLTSFEAGSLDAMTVTTFANQDPRQERLVVLNYSSIQDWTQSAPGVS